jgi:hypothetical protein
LAKKGSKVARKLVQVFVAVLRGWGVGSLDEESISRRDKNLDLFDAVGFKYLSLIGKKKGLLGIASEWVSAEGFLGIASEWVSAEGFLGIAFEWVSAEGFLGIASTVPDASGRPGGLPHGGLATGRARKLLTHFFLVTIRLLFFREYPPPGPPPKPPASPNSPPKSPKSDIAGSTPHHEILRFFNPIDTLIVKNSPDGQRWRWPRIVCCPVSETTHQFNRSIVSPPSPVLAPTAAPPPASG